MKLLWLGFGNVGRKLAEILARRGDYPGLARLPPISVVGITTASRGALVHPAGLDLAAALREVQAHGRFTPAQPHFSPLDSLRALEELDYDVAVEMTPLSIAGRGEPALTHVRRSLERGRHVISCNKGPLAWAYRSLAALARQNHCRLLFEATVMDGAPVFHLARCGLPGNRILRLEGILNSTTNFILCALEAGRSFDEALEGARTAGILEADPAADLDGWDAAVKLTVLANVLMEADLTPEQVEREPLAAVTGERLRRAAERGCRIKMVCEAVREGDRVRGRVRAREVPGDDPFCLVAGSGSILRFETDILGRIVLSEEEPDLATTAYGVLADLFALSRDTTRPAAAQGSEEEG